MDVRAAPNRSVGGEETRTAGWRRTFVPQQAAPQESNFFKLIARSGEVINYFATRVTYSC